MQFCVLPYLYACRDTCLGKTGSRAGMWSGDTCFQMPFCHHAGRARIQMTHVQLWLTRSLGGNHPRHVCVWLRTPPCQSEVTIVFIYYKIKPNHFSQHMHLVLPEIKFFFPSSLLMMSKIVDNIVKNILLFICQPSEGTGSENTWSFPLLLVKLSPISAQVWSGDDECRS